MGIVRYALIFYAILPLSEQGREQGREVGCRGRNNIFVRKCTWGRVQCRAGGRTRGTNREEDRCYINMVHEKQDKAT